VTERNETASAIEIRAQLVNDMGAMTLTSFRSRTRGPAHPRARAFALAAPWLLGLGLVGAACDDDVKTGSGDADAGIGGTAGSQSMAGTGGLSGTGGCAGGGTGGGSCVPGPAGSGGGGGSSGAGPAAGSSGAGGSEVETPDAGGDPDASPGGGGPFTLTSTAVEDVPGCGPGDAADVCDLFPVDNTGLNGGDNVSPQLDWTGAPAGAQSFAISFHDLSNLNDGDPFTHWVMWNIPSTATGLPAELPTGFEPGVPDANTRQRSFRPDDPFAGSGAAGNVYEFVLYALSVPSFEADSGDADEIEDQIVNSGDVLGTATLRARSEPPE
jgi:Raf kinase inhibitor-like YbhB/YbcL family protein